MQVEIIYELEVNSFLSLQQFAALLKLREEPFDSLIVILWFIFVFFNEYLDLLFHGLLLDEQIALILDTLCDKLLARMFSLFVHILCGLILSEWDVAEVARVQLLCSFVQLGDDLPPHVGMICSKNVKAPKFTY